MIRAGIVAALLLAACGDAARPIRAPGGVRNCLAPLAGALAVWPFDQLAGGVVADALGAHPGALEGTGPRPVAGPPGCGNALFFPREVHDGFVEVPHDEAWDLPAGSVDFWFRPEACPTEAQGVITRDAKFQNTGGHFRVFFLPDCRLAVRSQRQSMMANAMEEANANVEATTSEPLQKGVWSHVGINFGPPGLEVFLDGRRVAFAALAWGLEGNRRPWVMGVSNDAVEESTGLGLARYLTGAAIDHVRISDRRQPFGLDVMATDGGR